MMIDMNGPDIEVVEEVKVLILEYVDVWKNYKKRWFQGVVKGPVFHKSPHDEECLLSTLGT